MQGELIDDGKTRQIRYMSSPGNPVDRRTVLVFEQNELHSLLAFTQTGDSADSAEIRFDITQLTAVEERLQNLPDANALRHFFAQIKTMLDECMEYRLPLKNIDFHFDRIFYNSATDSILFAYLPFDGIPPNASEVREFFQSISSHIHVPDSTSSDLLDRYASYFRAQSAFSPSDFRLFLGELSEREEQEGHAEASDMQATPEAAQPETTQIPEKIVHDRPMSAYRKEQQDTRSKKADPGTTVLGELPFVPNVGTKTDRDRSSAVLLEPEPVPKLTTVLGVDGEDKPNPERQMVQPDASEKHIESATSKQIGRHSISQLKQTTSLEIELNNKADEAQAHDHVHVRDQMERPVVRYWLARKYPAERVEIKGEGFVVGKSKYTDYQIRNTTTVSRRHAIFSCDESGCWIEDNESKNGTFLDGEELGPHVRRKLEDGMRIRMSDEEFTFEIDKNSRS